MVHLSVNVNKVATLRNSRGGRLPDVLGAIDVCVAAGVPGITVHPRADRRHITPDDVRDIAKALSRRQPHVEFNIEIDVAAFEEEKIDALPPNWTPSWQTFKPCVTQLDCTLRKLER